MEKIINFKVLDSLKINLILYYIKDNHRVSVTNIADKFGLSRQSANYMMQKLLAKNLVVLSGYGYSTKKGGKRPQLFEFNKNCNNKYKRINLEIDFYTF